MLLRDFITLLGGAACTTLAATVASGQSAGKISRIGVLWHAGSADEEAINLKAIRQGLSNYGYIEGKNIILENRFPAEQPGRFMSSPSSSPSMSMFSLPSKGWVDVLLNTPPTQSPSCWFSLQTPLECRKPCQTGRQHHGTIEFCPRRGRKAD